MRYSDNVTTKKMEFTIRSQVAIHDTTRRHDTAHCIVFTHCLCLYLILMCERI